MPSWHPWLPATERSNATRVNSSSSSSTSTSNTGPPTPAPPAPGPPTPAPLAPAPPLPVAPDSVRSPAPAPSTPPVPAAPVPRVRAPPRLVVVEPPGTPEPTATPVPPVLAGPEPPVPICPARELDVVTKLSTPSVVEAGEAAVLSVSPPASLTSTLTRANDIRATIPRRPTLKPLTKLLGRRGLAPTLLLLTLATLRTGTPSASPTATRPTTSTAATPTAASTTATRAPTPVNSPTAATTSTAAPTTTTAATSTTAVATSTTPATLALAAAALRTSRSSPDVLRNRDVFSSSRGVGGGKGGGETPLKEGRVRSATSSTYSNCTSLCCEEMLLKEFNSEGGGVKSEEVVPDRAKRVREREGGKPGPRLWQRRTVQGTGSAEGGGLKQQWQGRSSGRLQRRTVPAVSCAVRSERTQLMAGGYEWLSGQQRLE
ncbi:unnamed protein product [Closterium sp. NIES-54]